MGDYGQLKTRERDNVREPNPTELYKGLAWIAAGFIGISFITTPFPLLFNMVCVGIGFVFFGKGYPLLRKYISEYKAFKKFVPVWNEKRGMYDRFAIEYNAWYRENVVPTCCDGDTLYFMKLQKERLKEKGFTMSNQVIPVKGSDFGTAKITRKSLWYTTDMVYEIINRKIRFDNRKGTVYEREVEQVMYTIIVHTPNDEQLSNITTTCPNCGAVSPVAALEEGCQYCNTKFRITDLFPRVVNLFFLRFRSAATESGMLTRTVLFFMFIVFVVDMILIIISKDGFLPGKLAACFFATFFCGAFLGVIIASLRALFSLLFDRDGMKPVSLFKWSSSKRKITGLMQKYDPNFSFDKFEGQIIALIRMVVFAQQPEKLACYRGVQRDKRFADILEMTYTNATCLKHVRVEGNILHMSLRTWWVNYSEHRGKVRKTGDCIDVELSTNIAVMEPPGFSITSVSCPACGGCFDSVRQKICPYCGSEYHMENEGWVIDSMRLIR